MSSPENKNDFALVPRSPTALEKAKPGAKRVLSGMVAETLALAKKEQITPAVRKNRIGEYELCDPDFGQLMAWAEQLRLPPLEVLRRLKEGLRRKGDETKIKNGKFVKLNWDPGLLPLADFRITFELELTELSFPPIYDIEFNGPENVEGVPAGEKLPQGYDASARVTHISTVVLPKLKRLVCAELDLKSLAIASAPALEHLNCSLNYQPTLNLRSFPNLKELACDGNGALKSLDLSHVPELVELNCHMCQIKELDLRPVPKLRKLNCANNNMEAIILPHLPELVELVCGNEAYGKSLAKYFQWIDLRNTPNLETLDCQGNDIHELDLKAVPRLRKLDCKHNSLAELDLSPVPMLEELQCSNPIYWPVWLETLDIRSLLHLKGLRCDERTRIIQRPDQHFRVR